MFHPINVFAVVVLLLLVVISGCAVSEHALHSTFEPTLVGRNFRYFEYMAVADAAYPAEDAQAERTRIEWLEEWLRTKRIDPTGYEIVSRRPVFRRETERGNVYDIFYEIRIPR